MVYFTDGCALDYLDILRSLQSNGFCLDLDSATSMKVGSEGRKDNKLRCLFDQILFVFLKEISPAEDIRTFPAMLGDGRCVDLFKLFLVVREKGGYDSVSSNGLWASVAEESELGSEVAASVKLLYIKYLDTFDRWIRIFFRDMGVDGGLGLANCGRNLGFLPVGLATEFKGLLAGIKNQKPKVDEEPPRQPSLEKKVSGVSRTENECEVGSATDMRSSKKCTNDEDAMIVEKGEVNVELHPGKRKRETLKGMLKWVTDMAKHPGHVDDYGYRASALLARNALSGGRHVNLAENSLLQKKQKTHPSMYEDQIGIDHHSMERQRCSERLVSQKNSYLVSCSESTDLGMGTPPISGKEIHKSHVLSDSPTSDMVINQFDDQFRKRVPIGPLFQAEVPEWTSVASENDIKWLGMQHWPMAVGKQSSLLESESIGKGRQDSCSCRHPGSVECVRFHIAERKMKLKLELGLTYYSWGFHYMGEEVSLSWTEDEEKKFKDIVRLNPQSLDKCFWDQACRCFPTRKWKSLISYYFNVFVLRRRIYQNRVTPANIDSDDDESEFGSVSNGFGHEAIKAPGSTSIFCVQNNQCIDLD